MDDKKIYGFVTVGTKGQVVIPAEARDALKIQSGDHLFVVGNKEKGVLVLMPESGAAELIAEVNKRVEDFEALRRRGPEKAEE